jgi:hypothetical protein
MTFDPQAHMTDLRGRDYLEVKWRLVWFREEHPDWAIRTEVTAQAKGFCMFRAAILDDQGRELQTGHGSETAADFGDYIEKAETKAVGRALAMLGYGTQFAPELDEGERIVDSPVKRAPDIDALRQQWHQAEKAFRELTQSDIDLLEELPDLPSGGPAQWTTEQFTSALQVARAAYSRKKEEMA